MCYIRRLLTEQLKRRINLFFATGYICLPLEIFGCDWGDLVIVRSNWKCLFLTGSPGALGGGAGRGHAGNQVCLRRHCLTEPRLARQNRRHPRRREKSLSFAIRALDRALEAVRSASPGGGPRASPPDVAVDFDPDGMNYGALGTRWS